MKFGLKLTNKKIVEFKVSFVWQLFGTVLKPVIAINVSVDSLSSEHLILKSVLLVFSILFFSYFLINHMAQIFQVQILFWKIN